MLKEVYAACVRNTGSLYVCVTFISLGLVYSVIAAGVSDKFLI